MNGGWGWINGYYPGGYGPGMSRWNYGYGYGGYGYNGPYNNPNRVYYDGWDNGYRGYGRYGGIGRFRY